MMNEIRPLDTQGHPALAGLVSRGLQGVDEECMRGLIKDSGSDERGRGYHWVQSTFTIPTLGAEQKS